MIKLNDIYRYVLPIGQDSLETMLAKCDPRSEIEPIFLKAAYDQLTPLGLFCAQHQVGRYSLDFALLGRNWQIGIECNGLKFHGNAERLSAGSWRDIELAEMRWPWIAYFWGTDIYTDPARCVEAVKRLVRAIR